MTYVPFELIGRLAAQSAHDPGLPLPVEVIVDIPNCRSGRRNLVFDTGIGHPAALESRVQHSAENVDFIVSANAFTHPAKFRPKEELPLHIETRCKVGSEGERISIEAKGLIAKLPAGIDAVTSLPVFHKPSRHGPEVLWFHGTTEKG